jgi:hypothetical protein
MLLLFMVLLLWLVLMIFLFFRATVVDVRVGALDEDKVVAAFFEDMVF